MQRSSRLQSTNSTRAPARRAASGVAMKVFDGHSTVWPLASKCANAASAASLLLDTATAERQFHLPQPCSNCVRSAPSDQRCESRTPSHSACSRLRSRSSNPIANSAKPLVHGRIVLGRARAYTRRQGADWHYHHSVETGLTPNVYGARASGAAAYARRCGGGPLILVPAGRSLPLLEAMAAEIAFALSGIATKLLNDTSSFP